jgi:oligoendopeptidase F
MNYKGYNIAVHEFGHNVEQTISLYDVDYYMLQGVPNTGFTEALAFIFQARDLYLLDMKDNDPMKVHMKTLDEIWGLYEIMGVSLVDVNVWKWMYANPDATAAELKDAVISIAKEIWNKYYAPVFGIEDSPILAIYSHMIASPLYLSNYAYGSIIDFQVSQFIEDKAFNEEVDRIWKLGRLTPKAWMVEAVGREMSVEPMLEACDKAISAFKK